ncbi:phosphatase PAP2 family protein [Segeticoccus rhizosphaerae]|uniref:phosphatase PAP2 family protein n=1 Tax=Segeticoccus rhizosphaerae TaxID=1104777 RepID=UPI0012650871|nr:phosphatase PAP2 family protein [Segeticoccus rhizosphaerae]
MAASPEDHIGDRDLATWHSRFGRWLAQSAVGQRSPWVAANWVILLTLIVGAMTTVLLTAAGAEVYDAVMEQDEVATLDRPVLNAMLGLRSPGLDTAVTWFTHLGGDVGMPILTGLTVLALCLWWRSWSPAALVLVAAAGSLLMTVAGKQLVGRARPPRIDAVPPFESSASFPSGHTLNSTVIAAVLAYIILRRVRHMWSRACMVLGALAWAVAMGLSRVYLGHHWLTDVMAAWALGLAWVAVVVTAHRLYLTVHRARATSGTPP